MDKPGYKTTEFWVVTLSTLLTILNQSGSIGERPMPIGTVLSISSVVIIYTLGRSLVKTL